MSETANTISHKTHIHVYFIINQCENSQSIRQSLALGKLKMKLIQLWITFRKEHTLFEHLMRVHSLYFLCEFHISYRINLRSHVLLQSSSIFRQNKTLYRFEHFDMSITVDFQNHIKLNHPHRNYLPSITLTIFHFSSINGSEKVLVNYSEIYTSSNIQPQKEGKKVAKEL